MSAQASKQDNQQAYLERQARAQHEDKHKLEVLVDGPEGLHRAVRVAHKEVERGRGQDLVREQQPAGQRV